MTQLVSAVVLIVVAIVLLRIVWDGRADDEPLPPLPIPVPPPRAPGPPLRHREDSAGATAVAATPPASRPARTRLFGLGSLTPGGVRHDGGYAVVGYTTTGFTPVRDRIVEIAVLHTDAAGKVQGRYTTYLSPGQSAIPEHLSHLTDHLLQAPSFARAAPHLLALLKGRVVVTQHAEFLESFLDAHLMESGVLAPSLPALCTFEMGRATFATRNHRLGTLAREVGARAVVGRSATDDAYAMAAILPAVLARHDGALTYPCAPAEDSGGVLLQNGPPPHAGATGTDPWLAELFARSSGLARELNDARVARFLDVLVPLLLQGRLVVEEVRDLTRLLVAAGYSAADLRAIQERLLENLRRAAYDGKTIPRTGLHHLRATAVSTGIPTYFDDLIPETPPPAPAPGSGSFSRPVRKPLPPAPPPHAPRCGHCLQMGHYTSQCPKRERGPVRAISPI